MRSRTPPRIGTAGAVCSSPRWRSPSPCRPGSTTTYRCCSTRSATPFTEGASYMPILGQNQYGKAENRVVKITRDGATHHIKDLNVSVALSGDMDEVHYSGSNANVLPTDTTKNTVFALAKEHGIESAEQFGIHLARHFVTSQEPIHRARIRIEEYSWERIATSDANSKFIGSEEVRHSFARKGQELRTSQITFDGENWE